MSLFRFFKTNRCQELSSSPTKSEGHATAKHVDFRLKERILIYIRVGNMDSTNSVAGTTSFYPGSSRGYSADPNPLRNEYRCDQNQADDVGHHTGVDEHQSRRRQEDSL
jgi:hypothetical protein